MAVSADEWQARITAMAAEPGFERLLDPATPVLVWSPDAEPLWSSAAGAAFLGSGRVALEARRRLRALAGGIAPSRGFRLERLRWDALDLPVTVACRLLSTEDGAALLTAVIDKPSRRPDEAGHRLAAAGPTAPIEIEADESEAPPPEPGPRRPVRFTWQTDAGGRFTAVSPELARCVGSRGADVVGRAWPELDGILVEDAEGEIARTLAERQPWTRRPAMWRNPDREQLVPLELSGAPSGDGSGFRGFGLLYPDEAIVAPPGAFGPIPDPAGAPASATAPTDADDVPSMSGGSRTESSLRDAMDAAAALTGTTGETVFSMLRAWFGPQLAPSPPDVEKPTNRPAEPAAPVSRSARGGPALTGSERGALHEIARVLQGPVEGESPDASGEPAPERPSAEIVPWPSSSSRRPADTVRVLDALPVGVVVARDRLPLFANEFLLQALGFEELPNLVARATLGSVLALEPGADGPTTVALPTSGGEPRSFDGWAADVPWGEMTGRLILLAPVRPTPAAEIEALRLDLRTRDLRHEELTAALDLAADGVVTLDRSARLLSLSRSAEHLFGIAANEVVGDSLTSLIEPRDHRAALSCLDALRPEGASGRVEQCEVRGRTRDGGTVSLSMRAGRVGGDEGQASFTVAFRDVTDAKLMEDDLRHARESAEQASANRADFLARVSHEIRTPLTAITGFAELMLEERFGPVGGDRYRGYVRDIHESGVHVISLVNDLLDLAKATSGTGDLSPTAFDLNAVAQQCIGLAGPLASRERTILRTSFASALPPIWADERAVRQIVINILSNAIRFTGAGGQVIVSTAPGGPTDVVLSVRDTGEGMSEDEIEAALMPFRQVPKSRRGDGTGLGLPLSKALAEANGGLFSITSARDLGTLVEVRLPVQHQTVQALAAE